MEFTEKYFLEELGRFRENFGNKHWWALPEEKRDACISGLTMVYLSIENEDKSPITCEQINKWAMWFSQAITEYTRRQTYIMMRSLTGKNTRNVESHPGYCGNLAFKN
jgi:hypothetical protein